LTLRRPPSSPLFPYTTLFRSEVVVVERHHALQLVGDDGGRAPADRVPVGPRAVQLAVADRAASAGLVHHRDRLADHLRDALEDRDRKSTRLNSSHVKISYAVF